MFDVQDRVVEVAEAPAVEPPDTVSWALGWPLRVVLASCLIGAAGIHLAMVPTHAGEWLAEGVAFAVAAWVQIALAILVLARPSRRVLLAVLVTNAALIGAWAWTRTVGPPFGPEAGVVHPTAFVDATCVLFELAVVILALAALTPRRHREQSRRSWFALALVPLGVLALTTAAIASPSAIEHDHGAGAGGHTHSHDETASGDVAAGDGHDHAHGDTSAGGAATSVDDKGLSLLSNGEMAHHHYDPDQPLDDRTKAVLVHQLALTRAIADRFPTLGDAIAAGSEPAGGFNPGMGIHMTTPRTGMPEVPPPDPSVPTIPGTLTDAEIMRPANLLYDGSDDDAPLAGFMYYAFTPEEPEGFAGPNDHWHTHGSLCIDMSGPGGDIDVLHPDEPTAEACQAAGGFFVERTNYMVHVWTIPGYESNRGVFSDINPAITCPDGTYYTVDPAITERYQRNKCRSNPA